MSKQPRPPQHMRPMPHDQGPIADDPSASDLRAMGLDEGDGPDGEGGLFLSTLPMPLPQATLDSLARQGATYLGLTAFDSLGTMWTLCGTKTAPLAWVGISVDFVPYEELGQQSTQPAPGQLPPGPLQEYKGP